MLPVRQAAHIHIHGPAVEMVAGSGGVRSAVYRQLPLILPSAHVLDRHGRTLPYSESAKYVARSGIRRSDWSDGLFSPVSRSATYASGRLNRYVDCFRVSRHSGGTSVRPFATRPLEDGYDIRTVQDLLGHKDVETTMVHTQVLNRGGRGGNSPLDRLRMPVSGETRRIRRGHRPA